MSSVIWITGLSGSGKSTLALYAVRRLRAEGRPVVMLDGDEMREVFCAVSPNIENFGREARLAMAMRYAQLCKLISEQGLIVVIATISLFRELHAWNRTHLPGYFEVYLKVPFDELRRRDSKGIYSRFDSGKLANVAGLDLAIDEPEAADWVVDFKPSVPVSKLADELLVTFKKERLNESSAQSR